MGARGCAAISVHILKQPWFDLNRRAVQSTILGWISSNVVRLCGWGPLAAPGPEPAAPPLASAGADCAVPSMFGAPRILTRGPPRPANAGTTSC
eukprot:520529-Pyramimonas_sp.AAC.1